MSSRGNSERMQRIIERRLARIRQLKSDHYVWHDGAWHCVSKDGLSSKHCLNFWEMIAWAKRSDDDA